MRFVVFLPFLSFASTKAVFAQDILITQEEFLAEQSAFDPSKSERRYASVPATGAPRIELKFPDVDKPVTVPTRVEILFESQAPAEPDPASFKVRYGQKQRDVTDRILINATLSKEGFSAKSVWLPPGHHQLSITLADSFGRRTIQVIKFVVQ